MIWMPLSGFRESAIAQARLQRILDAWDGTPYVAGQQMRGVGVDCVRFVCAVLDELYGFSRSKIEDLPGDIALHARGTAVAAMKLIMKIYEPNRAVDDGKLEPGDILVVAPPAGGPGHAMIVGGRENELWHSTNDRVQRTGIGFLGSNYHQWRLYGAYRACDRERWA